MAIEFFEKERIFLLHGKNSTYALSIAPDKTVGHHHWGGIIIDPMDIPDRRSLQVRRTEADDFQEYRVFGGESRITPALKAKFPDGARSAFLQYKYHSIDCDTLTICLKDKIYHTYFAVGDLTMSNIGIAMCIFFNKTLGKNYKLHSIYETKPVCAVFPAAA